MQIFLTETNFFYDHMFFGGFFRNMGMQIFLQFNLVCDNTIIRSHLKTTYLFGFMAASVVSQLSDM